MSSPEPRFDPSLARWAADRGWTAERWRPLAGDLSARVYFRIVRRDGESVVLAVYPPPLATDCGRFLRTTELLEAAGIRVPAVLAADCERGLMLVEDLGPATLAELATEGDPRAAAGGLLVAYWKRTLEMIERIAALPRAVVADLNPPLDADLLARELDRTRRCFLEPRGLLDGLEPIYEAAADRLCRRLGRDELVPCHRDLMVRNLVPVGEPPGVAVIDHQGLRLGPALYDLASLLNDTLFPTPADEERLLADRPATGSRKAYHRAAAQRTLKAVGTYADFASRGIQRHAPLIRPTFERALAHLSRCPEAADLAPRLQRRWAALLD